MRKYIIEGADSWENPLYHEIYVGDVSETQKLYQELSLKDGYMPLYCESPKFDSRKHFYGIYVEDNNDSASKMFHVISSDVILKILYSNDLIIGDEK